MTMLEPLNLKMPSSLTAFLTLRYSKQRNTTEGNRAPRSSGCEYSTASCKVMPKMLRFGMRPRDSDRDGNGVLMFTCTGARSEDPPRPLKPKMLRFLSFTGVGPVSDLL